MTWWISRLCEEFHCLPSQALREAESAPCGWLEEILEARSYAKAREVYDAAKTKADLPDHPMIDMVRELDFQYAAEELKRRTDGEPNQS